MRVIRHWHGAAEHVSGAIAAIGNFDGIHRGHQALIREAGGLARAQGAALAVVTFEPHPRTVLATNPGPFRLTTFRTKALEIAELGADYLIALRFESKLRHLAADAFVRDVLVAGLGVRHVVVGYDFVFGHNRTGNTAVLGKLAAFMGFGLSLIEPVGEDGEAFASGAIRQALRDGNPRRAARLLGRWWLIEGRVRAGQKRGRALGFPTLNLEFGDLVRPRPGIYASRVAIADDDTTNWRDAVTYIGPRPTFDDEKVVPETHIFDFDRDLYGRRVQVGLIDFVREDRRFESAEALSNQMALDCAAARRILSDPLNAGTLPAPIDLPAAWQRAQT